MDSTSTTTGSLLDQGTHPRPYAEIADPQGTNPPIYASLVAEWWARGRIVPGRHDSQWAALTAPPGGRKRDGAADRGRWERVAVCRAGADPAD
ncbi:hypothetical protein [Streptomyces sp. NBC_00564]|uniref:hypothetical protein n=1 Tax=Streptomyces sp. NBC_00564 TaxID=2903663 RepID=UPI00352EB77A|nr:hypothetical protein OG256_00965 [Streptomyces sp. NBC_00564]